MNTLVENLLETLGPFRASSAFPVDFDLMEPRLLVGGILRQSSDGELLINYSPATGEQVGEVSDASPADVADAVVAAREALNRTSWSTDQVFRADCLRQLSGALKRNAAV